MKKPVHRLKWVLLHLFVLGVLALIFLKFSEEMTAFKANIYYLMQDSRMDSHIDFTDYPPVRHAENRWYEKTRLVYHAGGGMDGLDYTNSKEAMENLLKRPLVMLIMFLMNANWGEAFAMKPGSWVTGWLPAVAFIAAGSSISWSMAAADWGAYVHPNTKPSATFWNTTLGAATPLFILMAGGVLLSTISPSLASASDPYQVMYGAIPGWFGFLYFLVAAGGIIPQCLVSFRSARINLSTIGIEVSQKTSLILHAVIIILISIYVLFISGDFLSNFELFLNFLGICLASWVAIFLVDSVIYRKNGYDVKLMEPNSSVHYNWPGIIFWIIATIFGFLFTSNAAYRGPFAHGIFENNSSLAVFVSGIAAIIVMFIKSSDKQED